MGALVTLVVIALAVAGVATWLRLPEAGHLAGTPLAANMVIEGDGAAPVRRVPTADFTTRMIDQADLVAAVVGDINAFWSERLPSVADVAAEPLRGGVTALDSAADTGSAPCVSRPADITGNAYYCPSDDGIVYDAGALIPVVLDRYGIGGLISTFAHEYGHAVQARLSAAASEGSEPATPLTSEARADCAAGAFLAWAVAGDAPHLQVDGDILLPAVRPLMDFADQETVNPADPTAHGLAVDRLTWFAGGYRQGAKDCLALTAETVAQRVAAGTAAASAVPRFESRSELLAAARLSIGAFARDQGIAVAGPEPAVDPPAEALDRAAPYGQFAQATVVALEIGGFRGSDPTSSTAAACFAGSWVRSVYGTAPADQLGGWPGDVDEGVFGLLSQRGASFDAILGYLDGLHGAAEAASVCG